MGRISDIKERINVLDYARNTLGLPVRKPGDRCCSLAGGSNPTALVIREDHFYDFKMGEGGDVIDLCAIARHGGDRGAAIRELSGDDGYQDWADRTQHLCNKIAYWHKNLRESDRLYLYRRRIKKQTVDTLRIGFDGERLVIPYYKNGYVAYYITRQRDDEGPKYKKAKLDEYIENIPWGMDTLGARRGGLIIENTELSRPRDNSGIAMIAGTGTCDIPCNTNDPQDRPACNIFDGLVIAEGAFDALSFYQEGYRVLSPMSGYFSKKIQKQVLNICQNEKKVFICFDSDDSGSNFQLDMAKSLFKARVDFCCGELPAGVKDISDYYAAGGNLQSLIDGAEDGVKMLCKRIKDRDEFKHFAFDASRFVGKPELAELFDLVNFPKNWLEQVKKQAMSAPPESMIKDEVIAGRHLKYFEELGFYEYAGGVWRRRGDNEIKDYIAEMYGHHQTGQRLSSVFSLLKAACISTEELNKRPIFNFRNGTLELETGVFREHQQSDMSSIQVDYNYEPEAYSERWDEFLGDICEGDDRKICLLQEIAGYVLFSDCSLQKCFFLMGDGSNGKSVFLDVLTSLYGEANVSTIEMSGLVEPFQRIHLLTSLVNISSETKTDVRGAESIFKQIVVGDAINGCYKNRDFLTFRPRTKLIAAFNRYMKSNDTSTGFMRRICFVSFNAKFSLEPAPGELKADTELPVKLKRDLPAIFNWAYEGYKALREAKTFTITDDQEEIMNGFMMVTNPVIAFIESREFVGRVLNTDLYKQYRDWCREAGHEPMSQTRFTQEFKGTAKQMKLQCRESKYAGNRCFVFPEETKAVGQF